MWQVGICETQDHTRFCLELTWTHARILRPLTLPLFRYEFLCFGSSYPWIQRSQLNRKWCKFHDHTTSNKRVFTSPCIEDSNFCRPETLRALVFDGEVYHGMVTAWIHMNPNTATDVFTAVRSVSWIHPWEVITETWHVVLAETSQEG